jgi:hypothetical protein
LRKRDPQPFGHQVQIKDRHISFSALHIRQKTPINTDPFGEFDLRPPVLLSQFANTVSQPDEQVSRHDPASSLVANQLQIVFTQHNLSE